MVRVQPEYAALSGMPIFEGKIPFESAICLEMKQSGHMCTWQSRATLYQHVLVLCMSAPSVVCMLESSALFSPPDLMSCIMGRLDDLQRQQRQQRADAEATLGSRAGASHDKVKLSACVQMAAELEAALLGRNIQVVQATSENPV